MSKWYNLLVYYIKKKSQIIKESVGMDLIDDRDIDELRGWSEDMVLKSLNELILQPYGSDLKCCPWCANFYADGCYGCNYGMRHGYCVTSIGINYNSYYFLILESLRKDGLVENNNGVCSYCKIRDLVKKVVGIRDRLKRLNMQDVIPRCYTKWYKCNC